jgi:hypothetical protein
VSAARGAGSRTDTEAQAVQQHAERAEADLDNARAERKRLSEQLDKATADADQHDRLADRPLPRTPLCESFQEDMKDVRASDSGTKARAAQCGPARATYVPYATAIQGKPRSLTGTRQALTSTGVSAAHRLVVLPIFQAGHAGSIPVARSTVAAQVRGMII